MVGLDLGTRLIKVSMTKLRKDETIPPGKPGIDLLLPESLQKEQPGSSVDTKKKESSAPAPKPRSSVPLRIAGKTTPKPAVPHPAENMFVEDQTSIPERVRERSTFPRSLQEVPDSVNAVHCQVLRLGLPWTSAQDSME